MADRKPDDQVWGCFDHDGPGPPHSWKSEDHKGCTVMPLSRETAVEWELTIIGEEPEDDDA